MKNYIIWLLAIFLVISGVVLFKNNIDTTNTLEKSPSNVEVRLDTPQQVEETVVSVKDEVTQMEAENDSMDAQLDELKSLSF